MERLCGECKLCCKLLAIEELGKKQDRMCQLAGIDGCSAYNNPVIRPKECADFRCHWLNGLLKEEQRPDHTRVVIFNARRYNQDVTVYMEDEPGKAMRLYHRMMLSAIENNRCVLIVSQGEELFFSA